MQRPRLTLREEIIEAARKCFYEQGYKDTSLVTIAKNAHTAVSNLYTYFSSKQELFNTVIGDIPEIIDQYITIYYSSILNNIEENNGEIKIEEFFKMPLEVTPKVSMTLTILLNGSQGTQYEHYKKSLNTILKDYLLRNVRRKESRMLSEIVSRMFIVKMLSGIYTQDSESEELSYEDIEVAKFNIDQENKIVNIKVLIWITTSQKLFDKFYEDYHRLVDGIDTSQYQLCVDIRRMNNPSMNVHMFDILKMYGESHYKKISCIFTPEQVAFVAQTKRMFSEVGVENVEIIYK